MKIINPAPITRWEEYKHLRIEALKNVPQAFLDDPLTADKITKEEWQKKINNMYFAEENGQFIGMIGAYRDEKKKLKHILNVVSFYVSPKYRGLGAGKALLMRIIEDAKQNQEIKKIQLGVVTTQVPALSLYKSLGFQKSGHLKYAVKIDDVYFDEYLMELYLS